VQSQLQELITSLPEVRIRLVSFSTTHVLCGDLVPAFAQAGFRATVTEANFGQVFAELMEPSDPRDALIVILDLDSLYAPEWNRTSNTIDDMLLQKIDMLVAGLESYAQRGLGPILINTVPAAHVPTLGLIDTHYSGGAAHAIHLINGRLIEAAKRNAQIILIEGNRALSCVEPQKWTDPKLWFYGRLPFSADATRHLASALAGAYRISRVGTAKVLALDLDNTLWGGIFGEDGVGNLVCDDEFPGNAFKAFQHECLRLKNQGILLTILSKNNPDAITTFNTHPGMLLREDDFVATRVNWDPKPVNIRSMAEELNLGLDSFVYIDDSPHEREAMRRMCPEIMVPELPDDPAARPQWLRALPVTWPIRLTEEDFRRSGMYLAERRRTVMRDKAVSFDDYLRDLEQRLIVEHASAVTLPRVAQMHLRTNQFNLTTARYDETALDGMMKDADGIVVLHGRALDKFGDHGIVICATARLEGEKAIIQSFLMSCRVVGRGIETAFLGELLKHLEARGARRVEAAYIETKKNGLVREFYKNAGLAHVRKEGQADIWCWQKPAERLPGSDFISVQWE
jgi:FkbH-like protein